MQVRINKGLNIPIAGEPEQRIYPGPRINQVALLGQDYLGLKAKLLVEEGEQVKLGQALFTDRRYPEILYTSPASGKVSKILRGHKRVLQTVTIDVEGDDQVTFEKYSREELTSLSKAQIIDNLRKSGLWTAFRTRPYSKIPTVDTFPSAIFISLMDSNPLSADPSSIYQLHEKEFNDGLLLLTSLTDGLVHICHATDFKHEIASNPQIQINEFSGPHPAGLIGTHIHFVEPVIDKTVWYINYQDVIAIGKLFLTGELWVERIISLAGSMVKKPRLISTRLGASTEDIVRDNINENFCRVVSGSILSGHQAAGWARFLGRYHTQVCVLPEGRERQLLGWIKPTGEKHSAIKVLFSSIFARKNLQLNTLQNGSPRAIVPIGNYESVMPLDILATPLLKSIIVGDTDMAQKLGCLELDEEDLALCSYVCSGKTDFGRALRDCLTEIERNG